MNYKTFLATALLATCIGVGASVATQTIAAQPPRVYGLYDANNTYLGDVVGINAQPSHISYTTYLPLIDGLLQFNYAGNAGVEYANVPIAVWFDEINCQGNKYIDDGENVSVSNPWIVLFNGQTYSIGTTVEIVAIESSYDVAQNSCSNTTHNATVHELTPITLPFDIDAVELPFELR